MKIPRRQPIAAKGTLFCAAWTVGSLARLLPLDRVESLTFYETTGLRGVMDSASRLPNQKPTRAAHEAIFPVYYVFEALAGIRHLLPVSISHPAPVTALAFRNERDESICLIANLTNDPKDVELEVPASAVNLLSIDETSVSEATEGRLPSLNRRVTDRGRAKIASAAARFDQASVLMKRQLKESDLLKVADKLTFEPHRLRLDQSGRYDETLDHEFPFLIKLFRFCHNDFTPIHSWHERLELFIPLDGTVSMLMGERQVDIGPGKS